MYNNFTCSVVSDSTSERSYPVHTSSAMKCAKVLGRCESGEIVTVFASSGRILSRVLWSSIDGGRYIRVSF